MLDFEYGVNTGNRFLQFVDHDEEPDAFIAAQTQPDVPQKKTATKDSKTTTTTKKVTSQKTTTTTSSTSASSTTKTNKENLTSKSTTADQRRQPSATTSTVFSDNNQQTRPDSARGSRGGGVRRGGGAPFDGASRGRSQRFNKFEGQQGTSSFDQTGEGWSNEGGARSSRGGGARRGNSDAPRGLGTGRGGRGARGGRGNFNNRSLEEGQQVETSSWQADTYDANRGAGNDVEISPQERPFESDNTRRTNRGSYRGRGHTTRNFADRGEGAEGSQEDYRANRRLHDRQPRNFVSTVKPIEKKDGEGAHNWGNPTENPEDHPISDEITETTAAGAAAVSKDWAQQVDEAEKQMTFDEYKKQVEAKKRANQEKLPQFKTRTAGEGEDPKVWQKPVEVYRKKNNADGSDEDEDEEGEEGSGVEENEEEEEDEEEQISGKKKLISIPLHFKPIEMPRGSSRGGPRRGSGNPRFRERSNRDEQSAPTSTSQDPSSQPAEDSQASYRGGAAPRGRGEYRRSYGNSARGSRQGRSQNDPNAPALDNPDDFPTLPKQ